MNLSTKERILEIANLRRGGISADKGPEYAGSATRYSDDDSDVLANFKRQGIRWGTSPLLPTGVYFGKHIDSIETFVREATRAGITLAEQREIAAKGEGVVSRLDDARNYLDLLECLLIDEGIVNDPRPEAYSPETKQPVYRKYSGGAAMLTRLGKIDGDTVEAAVAEGSADHLAEDYNYMRARVEDLRQQLEDISRDKLEATLGTLTDADVTELLRHGPRSINEQDDPALD